MVHAHGETSVEDAVMGEIYRTHRHAVSSYTDVTCRWDDMQISLASRGG